MKRDYRYGKRKNYFIGYIVILSKTQQKFHVIIPFTAYPRNHTSSILIKSHPENCITILCICVPWRNASTLGARA